jgi:phospholipid/cholesterol/gamma-HCH transport system substrate-binding protein
MAARANYVKIGLFVTIGLVAAAALAITVGALTLHRKEVISYFTYFNEAVTGLDVGAPVKARGVNVGQVGDITFAPDRRMVEVRMDMDERTLIHLGLHQDHFVVPAELRAQLASQGLTGSTFVSIDVFDPEKNPPPALTFVAPERYIPAATSELKSLEESVFRAMDGIASLADSLSRDGFAEKTTRVLARADDVLAGLEQLLKSVDRQNIPQRAVRTLEELRAAVGKVSKALDGVDGDAGLIATTQRSVSSLGDVGLSAAGAARELDETLNEIREAASAVHVLAAELERQPNALLKGRAKRSTP